MVAKAKKQKDKALTAEFFNKCREVIDIKNPDMFLNAIGADLDKSALPKYKKGIREVPGNMVLKLAFKIHSMGLNPITFEKYSSKTNDQSAGNAEHLTIINETLASIGGGEPKSPEEMPVEHYKLLVDMLVRENEELKSKILELEDRKIQKKGGEK